MRGKGGLAVMALALAVGGCTEFQLVAPGERGADGAVSEFLADGVRVTLTVTPSGVAPPGAVLAVLRYENVGSSAVVITSSAGCLSFAGVYRGDQRIPFPATDYVCTGAITDRELAPGQRIGMDWPLHIGEYGVPLTPGEYRFVAHLNTHRRDLSRTFVVR
jgi:hypothetical protein